MTKILSEEEKRQIYEEIREFLSDELDVPLAEIEPDSKILDDLGGDSMIYLELVEEYRKKFSLNVEIRVVGQYFQRHPIQTVQEVAHAVYDFVERGDELLSEMEAERQAEADAT